MYCTSIYFATLKTVLLPSLYWLRGDIYGMRVIFFNKDSLIILQLAKRAWKQALWLMIKQEKQMRFMINGSSNQNIYCRYEIYIFQTNAYYWKTIKYLYKYLHMHIHKIAIVIGVKFKWVASGR